jgi:dUTP pyrophosphatase
MSDFISTITAESIKSYDQVLSMYGRCMHLKIYVENSELKQVYINASLLHNNKLMASEHIDAGFDLFSPHAVELSTHKYKLDFGIKCSATMISNTHSPFNTGYYMYPRSSLSKTNFRLANCVGIIDSGYRGNLMGVFDILEKTQSLCQHDRLLQICAPALVPIYVEIVDMFENLGEKTERGSGGFGSSGR